MQTKKRSNKISSLLRSVEGTLTVNENLVAGVTQQRWKGESMFPICKTSLIDIAFSRRAFS